MHEHDVRDALATSTEFSKKHTSPVSLQAVAAAPSDVAKRIVIDFISVSADAAGSLQIYDGDGVVVDGYFFCWGASGGFVIEKAFLEGLPVGKGLKYTTLLGGNHGVIVKYHEEYAR